MNPLVTRHLSFVTALAVVATSAALAQDPATRSPAAEKTHAESADSAETESPLAAALARGDWLPLVVESLFIDATAPRELRKNWVVSFSGGVKARVHSPVKTFCASVGELPGKRFNVRFVDRAAATNALHGTIYSGELEVHPGAPVAVVPGLGPLLESAATASQRPVDPEPPSPPSGPIAEKMKRIVLPIVDFRLSPITEVVDGLEDLARNHDDPIAAARGQGITFVLDIPSDATDSLPLVTCVMKSVSVYSALDMIAEMSGLEWSVDGDVVRLTLAARSSGEDKPHAENAENAEPEPDAESDGIDTGCF